MHSISFHTVAVQMPMMPTKINSNPHGSSGSAGTGSTTYINIGGLLVPMKQQGFASIMGWSLPQNVNIAIPTVSPKDNIKTPFSELPSIHNDIFDNAIVSTPVNDVCTSETCQHEAWNIKAQMDEKMDPCDDFHAFACGGFTRNTRIAKDQIEVTQFSILRDKVASQLRVLFEENIEPREAKPFALAKKMYKSCMNTGLLERLRFEPLLKVLKEVGGWPVLLGNEWRSSKDSWQRWENLVVWFKELGLNMDYFVKIAVEQDVRNVEKRYITIGEPTLSINDEVMKRGLNEPVVNAYYKYMVEMAVQIGARRDTAKREMLDAANFEINMAKCFFRHAGSKSGNFYNPMTIQQMNLQYPSIPWLELFQRIMPPTVSITKDEIIMVSVPAFLVWLPKLIQVMANYAVWRVVSASVPYLHGSARSQQLEFMSSITGQKQRQPRWKECTTIVQTNLGNAAGAMYVRRYFNEKSKSEAMEMVRDIQRAFLDILNENDWMDSYTKGKAREKAQEMSVHIGYPEEHKSDAKITALYSHFDFKADDYFGNIRNLVSGATTMAFGSLRKPVRRSEWATHGKNAVVNAFYMPLENSIQFPAAILQGATKQTFDSKKQCIIDQYSAFKSPSTGLKLDGEKSQGENIADNGGIKQAYRGYQYWLQRNGGKEKSLSGLTYTPKQLFWIAAAQNWCSVQREEAYKHNILTGVHSPAEFRVRGTFANSEDFARDFQCQRGKRMNPVKKCSVW
ncbi:Neprilysin-11 [Orchesella cincta]|uniref:Neprilysin-11 n=1 Tax=Orchesella cincta TaxID=48709 RepID=A0A1D2MNR7_ORCCI|nr:Neprilysin-11 [Orchesella cincta]